MNWQNQILRKIRAVSQCQETSETSSKLARATHHTHFRRHFLGPDSRTDGGVINSIKEIQGARAYTQPPVMADGPARRRKHLRIDEQERGNLGLCTTATH
eukprot:5948446-Amphidinium_carterae.1